MPFSSPVSRLVLLLLAGMLLAPGTARSQDDHPLRIGDDEVFVEFAPFVQFDGGWASSSPGDLVEEADRRNGEVRRGRLYMDFGYHDFGGRLTLDFANFEDTPVTYAYLTYDIDDRLTLTAGQQDVTFSMQELMGSRSATFAENGQNATLQIPDAVGLSALYGGEAYSLSAGVFGGDVNLQPFDDGVALAARGTIAPYLEGADAVHFGLGLGAGFDRQESLSFSGDAGTALVSGSTIATDTFETPAEFQTANLEIGATLGRFTLQGEYTLTRAEASDGRSAFLHGGYLAALVFLTDDHRVYDASTGLFEQVEPARSVIEGGPGAFELGARLDHLDLTDDPEGGAELALTGIANWYPVDQLRFTASHTYTRLTDGPDDGDEINSTLLRAAIIY